MQAFAIRPQPSMTPKTDSGMIAREAWACPACNNPVHSPYCPDCGERPLRARDLTLRGFLGQVARGATNIDSRLIRSFRCLVAHPGALTVAYVQGQRKHYSAPLQLFFLANVLFFALHTPTGAKIFSAPLESHLHSQPWSDMAQPLIASHLEKAHTTLSLYAPIFDKAVALNAKSLIVLMVVPFALLPPTLFYASRKPFVAHIVFSVHFYTFLLLLLCLTLVVIGIDQFLGGTGVQSEILDHTLAIFLLIACATYLYSATGTFYGARGGVRVLKVLALTSAVAFTVLGYRFALLLITLHGT